MVIDVPAGADHRGFGVPSCADGKGGGAESTQVARMWMAVDGRREEGRRVRGNRRRGGEGTAW